MKRLLPYHRFELSSPLKARDAIAALRNRTEPAQWFRWRWPGSAEGNRFEGEVTASGFNVRRILGYRNSFAPIVVGEVQADGDASRIVVTMRLHTVVLAFLAAWSVLVGLGVWLASGGYVWLAALLVVAVYLMALGGFWLEARKQERLLREIFQAP